MKLYEEFKLYETLWDSLEEGILDIFKTKAQKADFIKKTLNKKFIVVCYKNRYNRGIGSLIKSAVSEKSFAELAVDKSKEVETFADVQKLAKELYRPSSSTDFGTNADGTGPICVFVANSLEDSDKVYLCQYFGGKAAVDNIDEVFNKVAAEAKEKTDK